MPPCSQKDYYFSGLHLWRNVIWHAMQEAQGRMTAIPGYWTPEDRVKQQAWLQRDAIEYLTTDNEDLRRIVEWCDFPMTYEEFLDENKRRFGVKTS